jgi:hypothetical protein
MGNRFAGWLGREMLNQWRQTIQAFAQRRHMQAEHVEAVIKILAERPLAHSSDRST